MSSSLLTPFTSPAENEFDFFKVKYPQIKEFAFKQLKAFWLHTDISYEDDGKDFNDLDEKVQRFIKLTIAFFFSSDGIVFKNIDENFKDEFTLPEIKFFYSAQQIIELIHNESYGLQLDAITGHDIKKKENMMSAISTIPSIKGMADWAFKYMDRNNYTHLERMIGFLCIEGIFFSGPFASIFWIRKYYPKKLKGIVLANDLISRDENLHCEFAVLMINLMIEAGLKTEKTTEIFMSATNRALEFVKEGLPEAILDMNFELMSRHIKSVANRWSELINNGVVYPDCKKSPFIFMENLSLSIKKNFFETTATEYQKAPVMNIDFDLKKDF